jgi:prophage antirepressor-like protein
MSNFGDKDFKQALQKHVKPKFKQELIQLYQRKVDVISTSTYLGSNQPLNYNDGKAVYISEPGLYSLIMNSNAPFAEEFQDMVYETIPPSIRKYGSYQVESQLTQAMEQLAIKDKSHEEETKELRDKLVKAERKAIRVNKFMKRITIKERWSGFTLPQTISTRSRGCGRLVLPYV